MPEGDTIHNHAAALRPLLVGRTVVGAWEFGNPRSSLVGREVLSVEAQGKHLLIALSGGATVHAHLGMSGRIHRRRAAEVDPRRHAASPLILATREVAVLFHRPRTLEILRSAFLHSHPGLTRLGPDLVEARPPGSPSKGPAAPASAPAADPLDEVLRRARALQGDRPVGELLLDQRVAAGIGNVYKSEILFLERVDPFAAAAELDDEALRRLYQRARQLLATNLGTWRRTTTADASRGQLPRRGMGRHHVYGRRLRSCFVCGTTIEARPQGAALRMTFYCPACQGVG